MRSAREAEGCIAVEGDAWRNSGREGAVEGWGGRQGSGRGALASQSDGSGTVANSSPPALPSHALTLPFFRDFLRSLLARSLVTEWEVGRGPYHINGVALVLVEGEQELVKFSVRHHLALRLEH